jgi:hypothetical protein
VGFFPSIRLLVILTKPSLSFPLSSLTGLGDYLVGRLKRFVHAHGICIIARECIHSLGFGSSQSPKILVLSTWEWEPRHSCRYIFEHMLYIPLLLWFFQYWRRCPKYYHCQLVFPHPSIHGEAIWHAPKPGHKRNPPFLGWISLSNNIDEGPSSERNRGHFQNPSRCPPGCAK